MLNIIRKISKFNFSAGNKPKYIINHDTGNFKDTALANANYFNGGNRNASAHYFVDDEGAYQVVEEYNCSWHCGDGNGKYGITNSNSIGIEMCNSGGYISVKTQDNTIELIKILQAKHNIPNDRVLRHYDASRKVCPENMSKDNWKLWNEFKAKLEPKTYAIDTVIIINNSTDELAAKYLNRAFGWGILMPHQYKVGSARRVVGIGGGACKEVKCDVEIIGLDAYDTCKKVMEYIIENRK